MVLELSYNSAPDTPPLLDILLRTIPELTIDVYQGVRFQRMRARRREYAMKSTSVSEYTMESRGSKSR